MSGHRPRTSPTDNILWRAVCSVPILGSLFWCANEKHSLHSSSEASPVPQRYFRSPTSGLLVHYRVWHPSTERPRGVIYVLHGIFEHVERYSHVGEAWAKAGFIVCGLDHQGHGKSEGDAGYFFSFDAMVADALHLAKVVQPSPEGVPRFLFGEPPSSSLSLSLSLSR